MELHPKVKPPLERIDFISRYRSIHERFPSVKESFDKYSNDEVLKILASLGYDFKYSKKENFFGLNESVNRCDFTFNIVCKYGVVEFIWGLVVNGERFTLGGPWSKICSLLLGQKSDIKMPAFKTYDDLREILKDGLVLYEDFKREVLKEVSST